MNISKFRRQTPRIGYSVREKSTSHKNSEGINIRFMNVDIIEYKL